MPPPRTSNAQSLVWSLNTVDGESILTGQWQGPSSPMDSWADKEIIRANWKEIMQFPVAADDGKVFDFDRDSRDLIAGAIRALTLTGGTANWRLFDNTTVTVDAAQLQSYQQQLLNNQALRGPVVDAEYLNFKANGATLRDIENWRASHLP